MEIFGCLFSPLDTVLGLAMEIFWIWMLVDCAVKEKSDGNTQLVWIVVIAVANIIGALIYFFVRRPDRIREYGE
jgi:Phospholipase_D-nuclease N-terminal